MSTINTRKRTKGAIIEGGDIEVGDSSVRIPAGSSGEARESDPVPEGNGEMEVETVTDEAGVIRQIVVQCACGERTVIECKYKGE